MARPTTADASGRARTFETAYGVALAGCLVSSTLTFLYVHGPAREANPITAALVGQVGLVGMFVVRTAVLLVGFRVYAHVGRTTGLRTTATAFAWVAASVQVADALWDLHVAVLAGPPPTGPLAACALLAGASAAAGFVWWPSIRRTSPVGRHSP
jgi:hypothetical protein